MSEHDRTSTARLRRGRHPHPGARRRPARQARAPSRSSPWTTASTTPSPTPSGRRPSPGCKATVDAAARPRRGRRDPGGRHHRQAVHLRRRRRPQGRRPGDQPRAGPRGRPRRPRRVRRRSWTCRCRRSRSSTARRWAAAWRSRLAARLPHDLRRRARASRCPRPSSAWCPGWGGCYLLPNLVGPANALKVIIENPMNMNRMLKGPQAFELGIADAMFEPADFLEESLLWAAPRPHRRDDGRAPRGRSRDEAEWAGARQGRQGRSSTSRPAASRPAPYRALELVAAARTASRDEAFAAEDEALADLVMGDELRAGLYSFDLVQRRAKRPAGAPDKALARQVTKVGIVGAGLMASQLALLFAQRLEVPVVMTDLDEERVAKGVGYVHAEVDKLLGKGRVSPDKANRLKALVTGVDLQGRLRRRRLRHRGGLRGDVGQEAGLGRGRGRRLAPSACSRPTPRSLSITEMAAELEHPERVVGFHFFNPVAVMPLLEIIKGEQTDDATLATAFATGKTLKKTTILVKDSPVLHRQPAPRPLHGRGRQGRRRGHPDRGRRPRVRRPRPDAAVRPARPGRPGDRAAQQRDPGQGLPRPLLRLGEPAQGRRGRRSRPSTSGPRASRSSTPRSRRCSRSRPTRWC